MFNVGEWVECKSAFQTPELAVGARYEIANVRKNSCGVFQVWLSYKNKWYSAARFKSVEKPQELAEKQTYSVVEEGKSVFKIGDKVVLTKKAKQKFKTIIGNDPYGGWNKNFEQMVYDSAPEIVTGIVGTQVWLCDGKFYIDINDITIESYNSGTAKPTEIVADGEELVSTEWTDKHYDFSYKLTHQDIENGFVKIDPYFVAKQWKIGSKDDSGALWHCFKTIARFGEKNSKEREIRALYAQIKRLADLEGIEL